MRIRAGVYVQEEGAIVCEKKLAADVDIWIGREQDGAALSCAAWQGPPQLLISADGRLHLAPGMRVNMCGAAGEMRIVGTYEELALSGVTTPIPILGRRMNIRVRQGISVLTEHVTD